MRLASEKYSIYLGAGVYFGGLVSPAHDAAALAGAGDAALPALSVSVQSGAAKYLRREAVRMCHYARRSGLNAWLVKASA